MAQKTRTFDTDSLKYIMLFEKMTRAKVKDCFEGYGKLVFIVDKGYLGLAVGKKGEHVKKLKDKMRKDIQVLEYSEDPVVFLKNFFHLYEVKSVEIDNDRDPIHATVSVEAKNKGKAIGKEGRNLRLARAIVMRHHDIGSVSVA